MLEMLVGAALRSLLLAAAIGLGLRLCRTPQPACPACRMDAGAGGVVAHAGGDPAGGHGTSRHRVSSAADRADTDRSRARGAGGRVACLSIRRAGRYDRARKPIRSRTASGGARLRPAALHRGNRHADGAADRGTGAVLADHAVGCSDLRKLDRPIRRARQSACRGAGDVRVGHPAAPRPRRLVIGQAGGGPGARRRPCHAARLRRPNRRQRQSRDLLVQSAQLVAATPPFRCWPRQPATMPPSSAWTIGSVMRRSCWKFPAGASVFPAPLQWRDPQRSAPASSGY